MTSHVIAVTMTTTAATESSRSTMNFVSDPPMPAVDGSGRNPHGPEPFGYRRRVRRVLPLVVLAALAGAGASALAQSGGGKATNAYTLQEPTLGEAFHRERPGAAADLDFDAGELPAFLGVVRRLAAQLVHFRDVGLARRQRGLHAGDHSRGRAGGRC